MVTEAIRFYGGDDNDITRMLRILECESSGNPDAVNPTSQASGLMQHLPKYWDDRAARAGMPPEADIFNPEHNIWTSAWLALEAPEGGWQHWVCR
jgi:soluble lytic murein transglycosylase-like protein